MQARSTALRHRVTRAVDRVVAEPVLLAFHRHGQPDPDRPPADIEAVVQVQPSEATPLSGGRDRDWRGSVAAAGARIHIDRGVYPDIVLRKGDKVRLLSRPGQPWCEALWVDDRDSGRLSATLGDS